MKKPTTSFVLILIAAVFWLLIFVITPLSKAHASEIVGDSLTVGVSQILHANKVVAKVGMSSCWIAARTPREHHNWAVISAGTNDPPGRCVASVRARINADRVVWIVPVNGARGNVIRVATAHGDKLAYYTPGKRSWPHPSSYGFLAREIKVLINN